MTPNERDAMVTHFVAALEHTRTGEIEQLRDVILATDISMTEHVKWNAPSYCRHGEDRITMRLQPGNRLELVFHRGAKKRADTAEFTFVDPTGLLRWLAPDRAIFTIETGSITTQTKDIQTLIEAWFLASDAD